MQPPEPVVSPPPDTPALVESVCRSLADLVRGTPGALTRLRIQVADLTVEVDCPIAAPAAAAAALQAPPAAATAVTSAPIPMPHLIRAPTIGVFYHAAGPEAQPLVAVGEWVDAGQQVGVLEAMKLLNPIESDRRGRVLEILVPNFTMVEYDQPLISLLPDEEPAPPWPPHQ